MPTFRSTFQGQEEYLSFASAKAYLVFKILSPQQIILFVLLPLLPFLLGQNGCSGSSSNPDDQIEFSGAAVVNPLLVNAEITATDAAGTAYSLGSTDKDGQFSFTVPKDCAYPLLVTFSGGHLRDTQSSYHGQLHTVVRNSNSTNVSASTLSTLAAELYNNWLSMPDTDELQRLDTATEIVDGLIQDFGTIDCLTTLPVASSQSTVKDSQRLRYANNFFTDLLSSHFAYEVRAPVDTSSADFSALVRSVALDLCDGKWDGSAPTAGDAKAQAWLDDAATILGQELPETVRSYQSEITWASVAEIMSAEPQAEGVSIDSIQPANPVANPRIQPTTNEFSEQFITSLRTMFDQLIDKYNLIGGVIALKRPSGAVTQYGTGMREAVSITNPDQTTWTEATAMTGAHDEHFRIASVSKTFTSVMILNLVQDGILDLDQTLEYWLGNVVPEADTITIKMLLQQTSGLYNREILPGPCSLEEDHIYSFQDLADLSNQASSWSTHFPPGSQHRYADINFILLAWIAETATGKTYKQLLQEKCFDPAGLSWSSSPSPDNCFMPNPSIHGYDVCESTFCYLCWKDFSTYNMSWDVGSGNVISTAWDLLTWLEKLDSKELLDSQQNSQMRSVNETNFVGELDGLKYYYGMGVYIIQDHLQETVKFGHEGYNSGYHTYAFKYTDYFMVILLNLGNAFHLENIPLDPAASNMLYSAMEKWLAD